MKHLSALCFFLASLSLTAQDIAPGGVSGAWQWWHPISQNTEQHEWVMGPEHISYALSESRMLNYWPSPNWQQLPLPAPLQLPETFTTSATLFVVYQPPVLGQEEVLWSWQQGNHPPLVSTNKRVADLQERRYLNFMDDRLATRLQTYQQVIAPHSESVVHTFAMGQLTTPASIPAGQWTGPIAEFVFYPKTLEKEEQQRVESYLALKYGTTLGFAGIGTDYLSSIGHTVWDAKRNKDYHHRVFGLGKDSGSAWEQGRSASAEAPDLVELSLQGSPHQNGLQATTLPDQHFFLLGDNDGLLAWSKHPDEADWEILDRSWKAQQTGSFAAQPMDLRLDLGRWLGPQTDAYEYQLIVSTSEYAFSLADGLSFPMESLTRGRFGHFVGITWPDNAQVYFTFIRRPKLERTSLPSALRLYPNPVSSDRSWQWQLRMEHPTLLEVKLSNVKGQVLWERQYPASNYFAAEEAPLPAGTYSLNLQAGNQTFTQKIVVQ